MGNCLVLDDDDEKVIEVMKADGNILRYQSPLKVHEALSEFPGHAISDAFPMVRHLDKTMELQCGQLYYLLPHKPPAAFAAAGLVRVKLVLSKQELKEILSKGSGVSLDGIISHLQREPIKGGEHDEQNCIGWRPALESIPEGHDFY